MSVSKPPVKPAAQYSTTTGMLKVAEIAIKAIAEHAKVAPSEAAEILDYHLWRMSWGTR
jgi:hypothetical protein